MKARNARARKTEAYARWLRKHHNPRHTKTPPSIKYHYRRKLYRKLHDSIIPNYILDHRGQPQREPHLLKWADWYEAGFHPPKPPRKRSRQVAKTHLGDTRVSTIFTAIDHGYGFLHPNNPNYKPVLWETMIFEGSHDMCQWRYTSREEAYDTHVRIVKALRYGVGLPGCYCDTCEPNKDLLGHLAEGDQFSMEHT